MTSKPASGDGMPDGGKDAGLAPGLYIVATPIGNARDVSLRALDVLRAADRIVCEDTRVSAKILAIHGIRTRCVVYHDHNATKVRPQILKVLQDGEAVALISDAGTPLISDPGYRLVREAAARGVAVWPVPGASAVLAALMVAGLPTDRFLFAGFLPARGAARRRALAELKDIDATLVVFESTRRLAESLADMASLLGEREAVVAREMTKLHEETRRDMLSGLARHYAAVGAPKGEAVIVIAGRDMPDPEDQDIDDALRQALKTLSVKSAATVIADITGESRREVYARALVLSGKGKGG